MSRSPARCCPFVSCVTFERLEPRQLFAGIVDGGFESPVLANGASQSFATGTKIANAWTVLGPTGGTAPILLVQTHLAEPANGISAFNSQEGLNSVDLTGSGNGGPTCGVRQAVATVAGKKYQLSFFVGRASGGQVYQTASTVKLSINGGAASSFTNSNSTAGKVNWKQFITTFTATGASTTITFLNGTTNNNFAGLDNVQLTLVPTTGTISGTVTNDANGDGAKSTGEVGLGGVKVFLDTNKDGKFETGEPTTTSSAAGAYSFTGVAANTYAVRAIAPTGFRFTSTNPLSVTVAGGATATANFLLSHTALISGTVFNDTNSNKIHDTGEKGISGVVVYLDFNNNGQLDSFELKTTTDANGNYHFVLPFGTYVVRQVKPSGKTQTTPASGYTLTVAQGQVVTGKSFGDA